jgi:glucose/arabinose dehydrogenase
VTSGPRRLPFLAAALATLALAPGASAQVRLQQVGQFQSPVYATGAPGDYERLYVVEQNGVIRVVRNGTILPAPFADLSGAITSGGERGLLSMAFAPDFERSRLLYVYFTDSEGDIRVEQLRAPGPDAADLGSRRLVIEVPHQSFGNHNGGQVHFGPDGEMWLATGDGGGGNDPFANAQNLGSLLGKVLRIRPRPGGGYDVPPDNPFVGRPGARPEIWSFGLRNPYRFSFDRLTGDLSIGDVGQATVEEVDYSPRAQGGGRAANFGWPACEGSFQTGSTSVPCPSGTVLPAIDQFQRDGWRAVINGYVVRDPTLPALAGRFVYGDVTVKELRSALLRAPRAVDDRPLGVQIDTLSSFGEDTAGCVYAASLTGPLYRVVQNTTEVPCRDRVRPELAVRVPRRQRLRRRRSALAYARCSEACTVAMSARLVVGRRSFRVRRVRRAGAAGVRVALGARLSRRARRALRRRRGRLRVALRARDRSGNRSRLVRGTSRVRR